MIEMDKPFSQACENNQHPILLILQKYLKGAEKILEVGSGTGQHAFYFANHFPNISWQTSDLLCNHQGINAWIKESAHKNIKAPFFLDVTDKTSWPKQCYDVIFSANTCHIMSWEGVGAMFALVGSHLKSQGYFFCYGPFNRDGKFTSPSNQSFDASLRKQNEKMGLRNLEEITKLAHANAFTLNKIHTMPANNMMLVFGKK